MTARKSIAVPISNNLAIPVAAIASQELPKPHPYAVPSYTIGPMVRVHDGVIRE